MMLGTSSGYSVAGSMSFTYLHISG